MHRINRKALDFARGILLVFIFLSGLDLLSYAATPAAPTMAEHPDALQIIIAMCFAVLSFFMCRTLRQIDRNQDQLFERINTLSKDFYELKGAHDAKSCGGNNG